MSLITYEQVRPWAAAIKEAVLLRKMPPWYADAPQGHFSNDARLSAAQIDLIRQWAESAAPIGDPKDGPARKRFTEGWQSGQSDLVLRLPHEERLPGDGKDVWKFIFFDKVFEQDTWIRGLEIRPGNRKVVHHANIHVVTPEGTGPADWSSIPDDLEAPGNNPGKLSGFRSVAVHVGLPGRFSFETEPGSAVRIPKGSRVRINIHYAPVTAPETDSTQVGLYFANGRIDKEWKDLRCKITDFRIPANSSGHEVLGTRQVTSPITVYQIGAHMHLRGQSYRIEADLPDGGGRIDMLKVPKFSFEWQLMYIYAKPIHLPADAVVHYTATYDNTAANPLVMEYDTPNRDVTNGERTVDEMMTGYVMYTEDSERLDLMVDGRTGTARPIQALASK